MTTTKILTPTQDSLRQVTTAIRLGGLIGLPTETVYGLAADATNGRAVSKIFQAKGRPAINPLIVHIATTEDAEKLAHFTPQAHAVAAALWPGPISLILKQKENNGIAELATAGLATIALRCPAHETARAVLIACGKPLAAPSANVSGTLSPTSAHHVMDSLQGKVDIILAAGTSRVGLESTVLDLSGDVPVILRPGAVTAEDLERILGVKPEIDTGDHHAPKSPGQLLRHYAPNTKLRLNVQTPEAGEAYMAFGPTMVRRERHEPPMKNLSESSDLNEAAAHLFAYLRELDKGGFKAIAVATIPDTGLGIAINDRLRRAASAQ